MKITSKLFDSVKTICTITKLASFSGIRKIKAFSTHNVIIKFEFG